MKYLDAIILLLIFAAVTGGSHYWSAQMVTATYHQGLTDGYALGQQQKMQHRIAPETEPGKSAQPKG